MDELRVDFQKKIGTFQMQVCFTGHSRRIGILGASGCGKSMTLKSIAGIETPDAGKIIIADKVMFDSAQRKNVKPQNRNIGYLFQNYALFPTMTVAENIGAGLKGKRREKQNRVQEMIRKFRLTGLEDRLPGQLSGGQQQRTALARIMAYEPDVILLDEPFSALDVFLKDRLQQELMEMLEEYAGIVILVSHSRDEIFRFSEELVVMSQGGVVTCGKTKDIFENPKQKETARLTGCKNFSAIRRLDRHRIYACDWGIILETKRSIPPQISWIGYRAHDFEPIWGERRRNCLKVQIGSEAKMPFEHNYYLLPEQKKEGSEGENIGIERSKPEPICWFVQREKWKILEEKGVPDYLELREEHMMFLSE